MEWIQLLFGLKSSREWIKCCRECTKCCRDCCFCRPDFFCVAEIPLFVAQNDNFVAEIFIKKTGRQEIPKCCRGHKSCIQDCTNFVAEIWPRQHFGISGRPVFYEMEHLLQLLQNKDILDMNIIQAKLLLLNNQKTIKKNWMHTQKAYR